jgi:hypothetical protein
VSNKLRNKNARGRDLKKSSSRVSSAHWGCLIFGESVISAQKTGGTQNQNRER